MQLKFGASLTVNRSKEYFRKARNKMGMSSSQARLLSLTARQHNIELRSQQLEAQKLMLANDSDQVYINYLNALDAKKTIANIALDDGTIGDTLLTANKIFTYGDLDKQYSLKAQNGKTLVSSSLHDAYQSTNSLSDFLKKFGLVSDVAYSVEIVERNPAYDNAVDRYEGDYEQWQQEMEDYEKAYQDYLNKHKYWEETEYPNWEADEPQRDDPKYIMTTENLGDKFKNAGSSCYNTALGGGFGCYQHILAHIIDYGTTTGFGTDGCNESWYNGTNNKYTTTTGESFVISSSEITGAGMDDNGGTKCQTMKEVSEKIDDETHYKAAVKEGETCDVNASSTEGEKLLSKWNTDGTLKSIKQWAKDLFYLCDNYNSLRITSAQLKQSVTDFQEGLAGSVNFNEPLYNSDHIIWEGKEPDEPLPPVGPPIEPDINDYIGGLQPENVWTENRQGTTFSDKNLAQWYINLWYKMEGLDETPKIKEEVVFDENTQKNIYLYSVDNIGKSATNYTTNGYLGTPENENYLVLQDDMLSNNKWITNVLNEGFVQIQVFDGNLNKFIDTSTAVDTKLQTVTDTQAIKTAEAQYEKDMNKINAKESKIDQKLQELEADRDAVKTQQDALKKVIQDNIDLSFKLFS